jgi:M6 family metalloprotease-like protein
MLFVDFSDAPSNDESTETLFAQLGSPAGPTFSELSYGRLSLDITPVHQWYRMPLPSTDYGFARDEFLIANHKRFMSDAIQLANPAVDFSQYEIVYVVASRRAVVDSIAYVGARPEDGIVVDGTTISFGVSIGRRLGEFTLVPNFGAPVMIHETTHLFGIPDLYTNQAPFFDQAGTWDYMSQPEPLAPGLVAWHRWKLGWLDDEQVLCQIGPGQIEATLSPVSTAGGTKLITVRTGPSTAYAVEVRQRSSTDSRLCRTGVLVYSVDASRLGGQSAPGPIQVRPARPDDEATRSQCGYLYNAPFDENESFEDAAAGVTVEVVAASGDDFTVRVNYSGSFIPARRSHARTVTLTLSRHLLAKGTVGGTGFTACIQQVPVQIQRKKGARFTPVTTVTTTETGTFRTRLPDRPGTYRARVLASQPSQVHACLAETSAKRNHRH